jgi:hypothetical protein
MSIGFKYWDFILANYVPTAPGNPGLHDCKQGLFAFAENLRMCTFSPNTHLHSSHS